MTNTQFVNYHCQLASLESKNEMLLLLGGTLLITGLLTYSYYLQNQKLIVKGYRVAGEAKVMYKRMQEAFEAKELAELHAIHIKNEFEKYKQQVNAKPLIR